MADCATVRHATSGGLMLWFKARNALCFTVALSIATAALAGILEDKEAEVLAIAREAQSLSTRCSLRSACKRSEQDCSKPLADRTSAISHCGNDLGKDSECSNALGGKLDICKGPGCKDKKQLNFEEAYVRNALGLESSDVHAATDSICWMTQLTPKFKALDQARQDKGQFRAWMYFGDHKAGVLSMYPGMSGNGVDFRDDSGCLNYDPRRRPWYVAASAGPKDVVLVLDVSGSMGASVSVQSGKSRMDVLKEATKATLDTFTQNDYIAVVEFNSNAREMLGRSTLQRATQSVIDQYKTAVDNLSEGGGTDFTDAITKAKDIMQASSSSDDSSQCNRLIMFFTDGEDNSAVASTLAQAAQSVSARIVGFTMGSGSDISKVKDMSCLSNGVFQEVVNVENPTSQLTRYYELLAVGSQSTDNLGPVIWSNPYEDAAGLGEMISAAVATYDNEGNFLGVASVDVLLDDLKAGQTNSALLNTLRERSKVCRSLDLLSVQPPNNRTCAVRRLQQQCDSSITTCAATEGTCFNQALTADQVYCEPMDVLTMKPKDEDPAKYTSLVCCGCVPVWVIVIAVILPLAGIAIIVVVCLKVKRCPLARMRSKGFKNTFKMRRQATTAPPPGPSAPQVPISTAPPPQVPLQGVAVPMAPMAGQAVAPMAPVDGSGVTAPPVAQPAYPGIPQPPVAAAASSGLPEQQPPSYQAAPPSYAQG